MSAAGWAALAAGSLFFGTLACLEVGYRMGRSSSENPDLAHEGIGTIEAAVFALLGLLLGFSSAGATSRLDSRRQLILRKPMPSVPLISVWTRWLQLTSLKCVAPSGNISMRGSECTRSFPILERLNKNLRTPPRYSKESGSRR